MVSHVEIVWISIDEGKHQQTYQTETKMQIKSCSEKLSFICGLLCLGSSEDNAILSLEIEVSGLQFHPQISLLCEQKPTTHSSVLIWTISII